MTGQRFVVIASLVGLAVLTVALLLSSLATVSTARIDSFQRTGDTRKIVVNLTIGIGDEVAERSVREDANAVTITVRIRRTLDSVPALGVWIPVVVSLKDPLGERAVHDATGQAVRDLGEIYRPPGTTPRP
jgi:hypothetical protein